MDYKDREYIYSHIKHTDDTVSVHFEYKGQWYFAQIRNSPWSFDEDDGEFTLFRGSQALVEKANVVLSAKSLIERISDYFRSEDFQQFEVARSRENYKLEMMRLHPHWRHR